VNDTEIINTDDPEKAQKFDEGGRRIVPLFNEMVKLKETVKQAEKLSPDVKKFSGVVNLVFDKTLKYNYLKRVMYTCAAAGYKEFKFVVMSEGN
jgi:biopolymer transport protein ExbD